MVFTGGYECAKCSHNRVCNLKDSVNEAKNAAAEVFYKTDERIEITVRCKEFREDVAVRTPSMTGR